MKTSNTPKDAALREARRRIDEEMKEDMKNEEMKNGKCKLPLEDEGKAATHRSNSYFSFFTHSFFISHKVAATFLAAAFLGGLAWAISGPLLTSPKGEERQSAQVTSNPLPPGGGREGASSLNFDGLRLDSILTIIAAHYDREVCFRDEALCSLQFYTTWDNQQPLDSFLTTLNEFDGLRLSEERDTIFVEKR